MDIEIRFVFADPILVSWSRLVEMLGEVEAGRSAAEVVAELIDEHSCSLDQLEQAIAEWGLTDEDGADGSSTQAGGSAL